METLLDKRLHELEIIKKEMEPCILSLEEQEVELFEPTREGYEFLGWYAESTFKNKNLAPKNMGQDYKSCGTTQIDEKLIHSPHTNI